jgi:hypothetical protein
MVHTAMKVGKPMKTMKAKKAMTVMKAMNGTTKNSCKKGKVLQKTCSRSLSNEHERSRGSRPTRGKGRGKGNQIMHFGHQQMGGMVGGGGGGVHHLVATMLGPNLMNPIGGRKRRSDCGGKHEQANIRPSCGRFFDRVAMWL